MPKRTKLAPSKQNDRFAPTNTVLIDAPRANGGILSSRWFRETIESVIVAFVLAFLFRSFEAEAFVIPTGSMAPTLMGAHKDLLCPQCGYRYQAGASGEAEDVAAQRGHPGVTRDVVAVTCPICRYTENVDPKTAHGREYPTYGGDRIIVGKVSYEFFAPRRWDVPVFKYPGEAQTNYIKRLVGLPEETVRLWHGDLYIQPRGEQQFHIEHRPPDKLLAMAQIVYDNDYVADAMTEKGWPVRWQPLPGLAPEDKSGWTTGDGSRSYAIDGSTDGERWLRYQHFVPSLEEWDKLKQGSLGGHQPRPRLITDFYAYDTSVSRGDNEKQPQMLGLHWVGDLMLECQFEVTKAEGSTALDLVKGGRHFRCTFNLANGEAVLSIDGVDVFKPKATTKIRGTGSHRVAFANIDEQLTLWVDGSPVAFDAPTSYEPLGNDHPQADSADPGDLAPAGVAARGAALRVSHLRLWRDIYYIAATGDRLSDYEFPNPRIFPFNYDELLAFWSTPALWSRPGSENLFDRRRELQFPLAADQFFMLGDNSPMSQDARLWPAERYVARDLLVGKALFIFWPHSHNKLPGTEIPFPFFPNFARMGFIR